MFKGLKKLVTSKGQEKQQQPLEKTANDDKISKSSSIELYAAKTLLRKQSSEQQQKQTQMAATVDIGGDGGGKMKNKKDTSNDDDEFTHHRKRKRSEEEGLVTGVGYQQQPPESDKPTSDRNVVTRPQLEMEIAEERKKNQDKVQALRSLLKDSERCRGELFSADSLVAKNREDGEDHSNPPPHVLEAAQEECAFVFNWMTYLCSLWEDTLHRGSRIRYETIVPLHFKGVSVPHQTLEDTRDRKQVKEWKSAMSSVKPLLDSIEVEVGRLREGGGGGSGHQQDDTTVIPKELRQSLYQVFKCVSEGKFLEAEEVYFSITIGTANWKLGLFSGGNVHMRRSLENVQKSRIVHLMNNESAKCALHVVKRLITIAQQQHATTL